MDTTAERSEQELDAFEERNTPDGLFRRYARGRINHFGRRQVVTAFGSATLGFLVSPWAGVLTLLIALFGELAEMAILRRACAWLDNGAPIHTIRKVGGFAALFQTLTICGCVALAWFSAEGTSARFMATAYSAGACLNAGLVVPFMPVASLGRIALLIGNLALLYAMDFWTSGADMSALGLDALGALTLGYMVWVGTAFMVRSFQRQVRDQRNMLTQNRKIELTNQMLRERERIASRLAAVAENANDSVIVSGPDGRIEWVNDTFTRLTGYSRPEALGKVPADLLNGPNTNTETIAEISKALAAQQPIRVEIQNLTKDGREIWVETNLTSIVGQDGTTQAVIGVERDISEAKQRALELAAAREAAEKAARAKANFLATMSHEIRTPMNGITGMADLLGETRLDAEQAELVETIQQSSQALLQILNDILDVTRLDNGRLEITNAPFSISDCVNSSVALFRPMVAEKGLELKVTMSDALPSQLIGDSGRIRQILVNVIGNAVKFTNKGKIHINLRTRRVGDFHAIRVKIQDTGIGIQKERLDQIFDRFTQAESESNRRFGGTGLGLTISRMLAQGMGGRISVVSEPGFGSTFSLRLTLADAYQEQVSAGATVTPVIPENLHLLVAEDNRTNRMLIRKLLKSHAIHIEFAQDGIEAVSRFQTLAPDVVLMDLSMPSKGGIEATQDIRRFEADKNLPRTPIIALTANAFESDKEACFDAGMDAFLSKPVRRADLEAELARYAPQV